MTSPLDALPVSAVDRAPPSWRPWLRLSRVDRPVGFWLLALPCFIGQALGRVGEGFSLYDLALAGLWIVGALAMRGAGCTFNDIADRDLDAQVARTAGRPLPAGQVTLRGAWAWLFAQLSVGFAVWLCLPDVAKLVALLAIPLVAAYPFMKRVTWWPQAWLGVTFNWGVLVGFAAVEGSLDWTAFALLAACACWTLGYDTIYALQDQEDDALAGVKSTARLFGEDAPLWVGRFYAGALAFAAIAAVAGPASWAAAPGLLGFWLHLRHQTARTRADGTDALSIFRSNRDAGLWLVAAFVMQAGASWALETWIVP
jgi:4-hydroxybenzoate polyprenyltransferase